MPEALYPAERKLKMKYTSELLEEHQEWAKEFGAAFIRALQGDYRLIDYLAHNCPITYENGRPILESKVIGKVMEEMKNEKYSKKANIIARK